MFLTIFAALFVGATGRDLLEPQFQVLAPNELMVQVPKYADTELVTFRIGVRRKDSEVEDLELGENDMNNNRIFIYDDRLGLRKGDVVNYLLAFRDKEGYQAQTGKYIFDGVYFKKPFSRRHRFRRNAISTTEKSEYITDDAEEFSPDVDSRFGGHRHHRPHGYWPQHNSPFGPPRGPPNYSPPQFPSYPYPGPRPNYGPPNCDHGRDVERFVDKDYHCRICNQLGHGTRPTMTTTTSEAPDIDIRFSD